jgi:hypothetical protein
MVRFLFRYLYPVLYPLPKYKPHSPMGIAIVISFFLLGSAITFYLGAIQLLSWGYWFPVHPSQPLSGGERALIISLRIYPTLAFLFVWATGQWYSNIFLSLFNLMVSALVAISYHRMRIRGGFWRLPPVINYALGVYSALAALWYILFSSMFGKALPGFMY